MSSDKHAELVKRAEQFAAEAHATQVRKFTGEPYINHPREVAKIVAEAGLGDEVVAAALLHDVVEDCDVSIDVIRSIFGRAVARLVMEVTNVSAASDGNRARRKRIDLNHIARASPAGQSIKLADIISNTGTVVDRNPRFARIYLAEKSAQLEVLAQGDAGLHRRASDIVAAGWEALARHEGVTE